MNSARELAFEARLAQAESERDRAYDERDRWIDKARSMGEGWLVAEARVAELEAALRVAAGEAAGGNLATYERLAELVIEGAQRRSSSAGRTGPGPRRNLYTDPQGSA